MGHALAVRDEKQELWLVDNYDLNMIYRAAKKALLQPDAFYLKQLALEIERAENKVPKYGKANAIP